MCWAGEGIGDQDASYAAGGRRHAVAAVPRPVTVLCSLHMCLMLTVRCCDCCDNGYWAIGSEFCGLWMPWCRGLAHPALAEKHKVWLCSM